MILRVLFDSVWQGAAIVGIAYLIGRSVPRGNAATRYAVWFAALLALIAVPLLSVFSHAGALLVAALRPAGASSGWTYSLVPAQSLVQDAAGFVHPATPWIDGAWAAGVAVCLVRLGASVVRIGRLRRNATTSERAPAEVLISPDVAVPVAVGLFQPAILIPKSLAETLAAADLERVVAHERAHLVRHDVAGNLIQRLVEALLFFNPWAYVVGRNLGLEREAACDDWAVRTTGDPDAYAELLASLARRLCTRPVPLATPSALGSRNALVDRIERLAGSVPRTPPALNYYAVGGTVMIFILLTLALEAFSPVQAFAPAQSLSAQPAGGATVAAAACTHPNADALVTSPVQPAFPHGLTVQGTAVARVTIAANGSVAQVRISQSSGNAQLDRAVLDAARSSTYSPKLVNCKPVEGTYLFRAEFAPKGA
jgi:TonB family protein